MKGPKRVRVREMGLAAAHSRVFAGSCDMLMHVLNVLLRADHWQRKLKTRINPGPFTTYCA